MKSRLKFTSFVISFEFNGLITRNNPNEQVCKKLFFNTGFCKFVNNTQGCVCICQLLLATQFQDYR